MKVDLLQICPYDRAPFRDICRTHSAAARSLGWSSRTVFLHSPDQREEFSPEEDDRYYMDGAEDTAGLHYLRALQPQKLCLFHRYRSLRVARLAGLKAQREVLLAHEFGLLASKWRRLRLGVLERKVLLAGVSPPVAEELKSPWVIPNALSAPEEDRTRVSREVARRHLGVLEDELVVGVLGRLHRKKNTLLALEGFAEFASRYDAKARLLVVGNGPLQPRLQERSRELKAPVTFTGYVAEATRYMQAFDLLLFPAADIEAFGMVALEAMLAEVPVVASNAPGPKWVLGDNAVFFERNKPDAVADALSRAVVERPTGRYRALKEFSPAAVADIFSRLASQ